MALPGFRLAEKDTVEKRRIDAKQFVSDFRAGMHKSQLMMKYELSPSQLENLLKQMVKVRVLTISEVEAFIGPQKAGKAMPLGQAEGASTAEAVVRNPSPVQGAPELPGAVAEDEWWHSKDEAKARGLWERLRELGHMWAEETKRRSKFRIALALIGFVLTGDFHYIEEFNLKLVLYYFGVLAVILALVVGYLQRHRTELVGDADGLDTNRYKVKVAHCEVCDVIWRSWREPGDWADIRDRLRKARAGYPSLSWGRQLGPVDSLDKLSNALDKLAKNSSDKDSLSQLDHSRQFFWDMHCDDYPMCKKLRTSP